MLGILLMIGEVFTPGVGALGIGGLAAFIVGALFLFEGGAADIDLTVSIPLIIGAAAATAGLAFFVVGAAAQARRRPPALGPEELVGSVGHVIDWQGTSGKIRLSGEVWNARSAHPLKRGDTVRVVAREGLTLAEAERIRRAKIIDAEGELQAAVTSSPSIHRHRPAATSPARP